MAARLRWPFPGAMLALVLAGCAAEKATAPGIPVTPAGITGRITSISANGAYRGTIRVESDPTTPSGPKALVTVTGETAIYRIIQTPVSTAETDFRGFDVGQWVRVWFDGPVLESYPVQGSAGTVVIDSVGTGLANRIPR